MYDLLMFNVCTTPGCLFVSAPTLNAGLKEHIAATVKQLD